MMKKFYVLVMSAAMVASLTACGGQTAANEIQAEVEVVEEIEAAAEEEEEVEETQGAEKKEQASTDGGYLDALEEQVAKDVEESIGALTEEYDSLVSEIDSYEKYVENFAAVEGFYAKVYDETHNLCIRMREHSVEYANTILAADKENDEKYDDLDEMYDCIYDEAGDEIYDEIYSGILDDIYDDFYGGVLDDAYEDVEYSEWSDACSNEYDMWSDTCSDVYDEWSDCLSDVYDFWSDLQGEMWDDDPEKAQEIVEDFIEDIDKLRTGAAENDSENQEEADTDSESDADAEVEEGSDDLVDGMRPEFKEAMDSYEEFYEKYCDVLKKYTAEPTDVTVLTEYSELLEQSIEMSEKFKEWENDELNTDELKYYVEVNGRVTQMFVEASGQ